MPMDAEISRKLFDLFGGELDEALRKYRGAEPLTDDDFAFIFWAGTGKCTVSAAIMRDDGKIAMSAKEGKTGPNMVDPGRLADKDFNPNGVHNELIMSLCPRMTNPVEAQIVWLTAKAPGVCPDIPDEWKIDDNPRIIARKAFLYASGGRPIHPEWMRLLENLVDKSRAMQPIRRKYDKRRELLIEEEAKARASDNEEDRRILYEYRLSRPAEESVEEGGNG